MTYPASISPAGPVRRPRRLPLVALAATLIAYLTMFLVARRLWELPLLAVAVLLSYVVNTRLRGSFFRRLPLRIVLLVMIYVLNPDDPTTVGEQFGSAQSRNVIALICATEAALQFWVPREIDAAGPLMLATLASGLVLLSASNSISDQRYIEWLTPAFFLFAAIAARDYRGREKSATTRRSRRLETGLRAAALLTATGIGAASYGIVFHYRGALSDMTNHFLLHEHPTMEATGMSQQPSLGPTFGLRGSAARVLRIQGSSEIDPHWRGLAFYTYESGTWGPSSFSRGATSGNGTQLLGPVAGSRAISETDLRVTRLSSDNPLLFAPLGSVSIDPGDGVTVSWAQQAGGPLWARSRGDFEYTVSVPDKAALRKTNQGVLASPIFKTRRDWIPYLQVPPDESDDATGAIQVRKLALRITAQAKTPVARIQAITEYLLHNYSYSLEFHLIGKPKDPVGNFLLAQPKRGAHCEYFASSAVLLLRYAGIPARYVTGYYAHESEGHGVTAVRQRDAHAWCEAWLDGVGWITVDATPGDGRPEEGETSVESWRKVSEWLQDRMQAFRDFLANLTAEQTNVALGVVAGGSALYGLSWFLLKRRRGESGEGSGFGPRGYTPSDIDLTALARRFEAIWERQGGTPFPLSRTYSDYLRTLSRKPDGSTNAGTAAVPGSPPPMANLGAQEWAALYDAARYGGHYDAADQRAMEEMLNEWEKPANT